MALQVGDQIIKRCNFDLTNFNDFNKACVASTDGTGYFPDYISFKVIRNGVEYFPMAKILSNSDQQLIIASLEKKDKLKESQIDETLINEAKNQCKKIGFKIATSDFNNCVLKIYTTKIEKLEKSPVAQQAYTQSPNPQIDQDLLKRQEVANQELLRQQRALTVMQYLNNMRPYQLPAPQPQQPKPITNTNCTRSGDQFNCTSF